MQADSLDVTNVRLQQIQELGVGTYRESRRTNRLLSWILACVLIPYVIAGLLLLFGAGAGYSITHPASPVTSLDRPRLQRH